MSWIILSLLTAIFSGTIGAINKRVMRNISEYIIAFTTCFFPAFFLFFFLLISIKTNLFTNIFQSNYLKIFFIPLSFSDIPTNFWFALFASGTLGVFTTILYLKTIKNSDLSETLPLLTFTPVFSIIVSPIILGKGEIPNIFGVIGIFLIVSGSYILNIKEHKENIWKPFKMLIKNKGSLSVLLLAFIYSITSVFDKIGSSATSSLFWSFCLNTFIFIAIIPILVVRFKTGSKQFKKIKNGKIIFVLLLTSGLLGSISLISQMTAIQLSKVAYVISIKRTGIILAVFLGYLFFKEKNIKERLLASATMILGVIFLTLFN